MMNREQLVRDFARGAHVSRREAQDTLQWLADVVADALRRGEQVTIEGVGTFRLRRVRGRKPLPVFTPAKELAVKARR